MPNALSSLLTIDRLEVGPVKVEPRRLIAPYRVTTGGTTEETELAYKWEEDVFGPDDAASRNLASLAAAQVALNYGLFCREIVFHGPFDRHDRVFLRDAAANTAREIYVKKFLEPNPFLTGTAVDIETERRDSYLQSELHFPDAEPAPGPPSHNDPSKVAILSSGGKDSLLSYGLLDEIGAEAHPVYVNESGRHWLTALNAHRHFAEHVPLTSRVWTSSDRVFSWMLRRLPFIRPDFASVRSDEYPIRLWTVAVFLFGVLPLARARGIGNVVIGNEFDTTHRTRYGTIPHYDGLYDQSRFFDNALSRFYRRKGWDMAQFSILRPLSELLIEKTLVERHPDLQSLQVSCHAAHKDGEKVRPCGRCEKCRRIVGMLRAVGADPGRCGYTPEQIENAMGRLAAEGVHQESAGAEHMMHLLVERGDTDAVGAIAHPPRPHPEVLRLRFDREHAPIDGVPIGLRADLIRLQLEHADGAVRRNGRMWLPFDPLTDPDLHRPFAFESNAATGRAPATTGQRRFTTNNHHLLSELTWPEAEQRFREVDVALLPVGAVEQHGPHLPLDTDAWDADYLAQRVAAECSEPKPLALPLIPYGVSFHHDDFPGTIGVSNDALARMVYDVGMSCARNGITKLVIINGHGGNQATLQFAAQMINRDARIFTTVDTGETSDVDLDRLCETANDVHAGEIETSTSLATRPHLVRMDLAEREVQSFSSRYLDFSARRSVEWYARTAKISDSGVLGDPTRATAEKGREMWEIMVRNLVELVEHLKALTLEEIYERRY